MQQRRMLYSAATHGAEKSALLQCCICSREQCSSLTHVQQWIRVDFSTTCAVEQTTVPSTSSSNSKNIGVSAFPSICSGVLFPPLQEHWSTVLSATCAAVDNSGLLCYMSSGADHSCPLHVQHWSSALCYAAWAALESGHSNVF